MLRKRCAAYPPSQRSPTARERAWVRVGSASPLRAGVLAVPGKPGQRSRMHFRLAVEQPKSREIVNYISKPPRGVRVGRMRVRDAIRRSATHTGRVASKVAHETECE